MRIIPLLPHPGDPAPASPACAACSLRALCLPQELDRDELLRAATMVTERVALVRGEALFRHGDAFQALYAVRTGFLKTRLLGTGGEEWVTGFRMAGDLVGLEGLADDHHVGDALALEDSQLCVIPYGPLADLLRDIRPLQRQFHRLLGQEISRDASLRMPGRLRADTRVAAFLLDLARRQQARGFSPSSFVLRMTRAEIGSYLGLTLETVSRAFSAFHSRGWIEVRQRDVRLVDAVALAGSVAQELPC